MGGKCLANCSGSFPGSTHDCPLFLTARIAKTRKGQIEIQFATAERAKAAFRSFDTIKHIASHAPGLPDCIVGLWRLFLGKVSQILVKLQLLPDHPYPLQ